MLRQKVRLYEKDGRYVAVLMGAAPCTGTSRCISEALVNLAKAMVHSPAFGVSSVVPEVDSVEQSQGNKASAPDTIAGTEIPLAKRLLVARFGRLPLRQLAEELGLDGVPPALLSASISGKGARRVWVAIALALGTDPQILWPHLRERPPLEQLPAW